MILITGGTGFVGQEVVAELLALGHQVRLLVRNPSRARHFAGHSQVELIEGDVLRPETLPAAMMNVQAVIHLVGIIAETSRVTYEQAHFEATRNLLDAAKRADVTRWLQMSAAGTRPEASSRYHLTKWQAEELIRQSGLDWTIFRPSLIYGYDKRDRLLNLLRKVLSKPVDSLLLHSLPLLDGGRPLIQPVSVREVAHCFAHGLSKPASIGRTFELVGPVSFSWRAMVLKMAAALGKSVVYEEFPLLLLLRKLLWIVVILIPILIVAGVIKDKLSLLEAEVGAAFWIVLAVMAGRWKQTILFNVPGSLVRFISRNLDPFLPRGLRTSDPLKMAAEDNVGDPRPAAETFGYEPESFEVGLARIVSL